MNEVPQGLRDQFQNLCELKTELGNDLLRQAKNVTKKGLSPSMQLVATIETFRNRYAGLQSELSLSSTQGKPDCMNDLEEGFKHENVRNKVITILDEVATLSHVDNPEFAPLMECQTVAKKIIQQIKNCQKPTDDPDAQKLISGEHGLTALLMLAKEGDQLEDAQWTLLQDQLTDAIPSMLSDATLGRQLITAVSRGRLKLPESLLENKDVKNEETKPTASSSDSSVDEPVLAPSKTTPKPPAKSSPSVFDSDTDLTASEQVKSPSSKRKTSRNIDRNVHTEMPGSALPIQGPIIHSTATPSVVVGVGASDFAELSHRFRSPLPLLTSQGESSPIVERWGTNQRRTGEPTVSDISSIPITAETSVEEIAQAAYYSNGEHRDRSVSHLIWRMLTNGRHGIAYHLSRCLEQRVEISTRFVPSQLIRAVTLGQNVRHPVGEVAKVLTNDFMSFSSEMTNEELEEWNLGIHFLLQSATLRPALIAPATGATHVLRNVKMLAGGSEMHNYRVRVALFGDQSQPLDPNIFKRATNEVDWIDETEQLQLDIESWQPQAQEQTIRYLPATQIFLHSHWSLTPSKTTQLGNHLEDWKIWNQVILTVDQVLRPILENNTDQIRWVRERVDLLASMVPVDEGVNSEEVAALPDKEMRVHVREGVSFARRWLALHDARPGQTDWVIPQPAIDLNEEIRQRQEGVFSELAKFETAHSSFVVSSAIACYRNALHQLYDLFDTETPFLSEVLNPRHLLHAELLRNPTLPMNENWEPNVSIQALETDLLELIMNGEFSWQDAFEARSSYRDHEATQRMLELDIWSSETERHQYYEKRESRIAQCRTMLQRDIVETRARVQNAVALGLLGIHDQELFKTQLDLLEALGKKTNGIANCYTQLRDICDGMERRRQAEIERVKQRFEQLQLPDSNLEHRQITTALENGNIAAANQFIESIETTRNSTDADWVR
ncbi:hypothetical protein MNBD_PLANCTO02-1444 [hydrothermal vent metagenome]|uniref:Uncharacterized protein n=1 Tax=hydrothermal vent metagenome TaxID=652676 RepID=A0A3B1DDS0_9ZZZZ